MVLFVRTDVVVATFLCDAPNSTLNLVGVRGPAQDRSVWCPYQTGHLPNVPAGGGAVRGPDGATVPDPEQLVNVRGGFGGDNVWICWLVRGNYRMEPDYGHPAAKAVRKALRSKKSSWVSLLKSAAGSADEKAARNAEMSKKSNSPSLVRSAGQVWGWVLKM